LTVHAASDPAGPLTQCGPLAESWKGKTMNQDNVATHQPILTRGQLGLLEPSRRAGKPVPLLRPGCAGAIAADNAEAAESAATDIGETMRTRPEPDESIQKSAGRSSRPQ
jgi:hypothetical protein